MSLRSVRSLTITQAFIYCNTRRKVDSSSDTSGELFSRLFSATMAPKILVCSNVSSARIVGAAPMDVSDENVLTH